MDTTRLTGVTQLPDGTWIRGRGLWRPPPTGIEPEYGVYLGTGRMRRANEPKLTWPHEWIDWPDFLLPRDRDKAISQIQALYERARTGQRVEVACGGGVGRTGTVISCLAILAGKPPTEAVAWTRANYNPKAVETPWQARWVTRFPTP